MFFEKIAVKSRFYTISFRTGKYGRRYKLETQFRSQLIFSTRRGKLKVI